ncbi:MAG: alpha/beta hydrolase [Holosporaceae bacterium]|jgi:acetyl esterase|nr:alpha/beta hydrolase [Holosporaceae bacterium]
MYNTELLEQSKRISDELGVTRSNFLKKVAEDPSLQPTAQMRRELANKFFIKHGGPKTELAKVEDLCIAAEDGYQIPVRRYYPATSNDQYMFMYIHGGGWMQGNIETHDYLCRKIAHILHAEVLSVDYRLAPEHIYPTHLNDVSAVYSWCVNNTGKEIIVSGDSAGGNLSTALCLNLLETNGKKPHALMLIYPPLSNDFDSQSFEIYKDIEALTKIGTIDYTMQYAGKSSYDELKTVKDKFIFPLLADDFKAFPPTIIISAGCDVLLDASLELAKRLKAANVAVHHIVVDGAIHGFMSYGEDFDREVTDVLNSVKKIWA